MIRDRFYTMFFKKTKKIEIDKYAFMNFISYAILPNVVLQAGL